MTVPKLTALDQSVLQTLMSGPKTLRDLRALVSGTREEIAASVRRLNARAIVQRKRDSLPSVWYLPEAEAARKKKP